MRLAAARFGLPALLVAASFAGCATIAGDFTTHPTTDGGEGEDASVSDAASESQAMDSSSIDSSSPGDSSHPTDGPAVSEGSTGTDGSAEGGSSNDAAADGPVQDASSCTGTPTPTITGTLGFCPGGSTTLTASSASSYMWSTGATTQSISVTTAGDYTVTTVDAHGCHAMSAPSAVVAYSAPSAPTISAGGSTNICPGSSVLLSSSVGTTYSWSTSSTGSPVIGTGDTYAASAAGTYYVSTANADGCKSPESTGVSVTEITVNHGTSNFSAGTGGTQFTVGTCITSLTIDMAGAQGGAVEGGVAGGLGGRLQATLSVSPGTVFEVFVGGAGVGATSAAANVGGYNGGGTATVYAASAANGLCSGTGGGASDIRVSPFGVANRILVAGGGGGAGCDNATAADNGGAGGGLIGQEGLGSTPAWGGLGGGGGGTQGAGGAGGTDPVPSNPAYNYPNPAGAGAFFSGGNSGPGGMPCGGAVGNTNWGVNAPAGGGGGGGYYGGGGGCWIGGGGGSNYAGSGTSGVTHTQGYQSGGGYVTITY
jgi:hypothetical protein